MASLSLNIPTMAIGWHYKYYNIMKLFGLEDFLYDVNDFTYLKVVEDIKKLLSTPNLIDKMEGSNNRINSSIIDGFNEINKIMDEKYEK